MLCVSIGRSRHQQLIDQHREMVAQGATLVELRLDYLQGTINVQRLLADRPGPVLISCRRSVDGGKYHGSEADRLLLLRTAISEGAEYIDLEEDVAQAVPRFGATQRMISLHDFRRTPDDLPSIHARLAGLDADIVKIATMANQPSDNLRMLRLIAAADMPTVGICMGEMGTPSRLLAAKFGAAFTYCTFHHERALAPGQLSFREMMDVYDHDRIGPATQVYGVIGDPIGHSLSPLVHNAAFRHLGINAVYVPFRIPREHVDEFLATAGELDVRGLSVTIPHKEAVLKHLTETDEAVRGIEAANTIVFDGPRRLGYNTDYTAARQSLDRLAQSEGDGGEFFRDKTALVLGSGGAAKAIAYELQQRGLAVTIAGRTYERSQELADRLNCKAVEWKNRHAVAAGVLVNCTPIGMHPEVDESPYEKHHMKPSMVVFDTVYNPENTLLIKHARSRNCKVITGIEMFVGQAARQFELFTGKEAPTDLMHDVIRRAIGPAKY